MISFSIFKKENAFSFISMALFIAFLSMGAAMVIALTQSTTGSGSADITLKRMISIKDAIAVYKEQHSSNPPNSLDDLLTRTGQPCSMDKNSNSSTYRKFQGWCGPYINNTFSNSTEFKRDGWGTLLQYDKINIKSCGANLTCGDADDILVAI